MDFAVFDPDGTAWIKKTGKLIAQTIKKAFLTTFLILFLT